MDTFVSDLRHSLLFNVTKSPLNLIGLRSIGKLGLSLDSIYLHLVRTSTDMQFNQLQQKCQNICKEFQNLFKEELGCLKDVKLDIKFKFDAKLKFCKPRPVPLALQEDLNAAYDTGIKRGIWKPVTFNSWVTPVVPIRKVALPGKKAALRVCGDYSVTVNCQLEEHRQPIPLPEDLMRKLGGGFGFTKIDLADAYNQIELSEEFSCKLDYHLESAQRPVIFRKLWSN